MLKKTKKPKKPTKGKLTKKPKVDDNKEKILIIAVDRDDDVGDKLSVSGPIIGVKNNLKVATNFAIVDPEDSDANCMFAAIKKYKELEKDTDVEIVTLTGHSKENLFFADKNIALQLRKVLEKYPATAAIFLSDGAEDSQVMPIIQNYVPIISIETVIVRQAKGLESTFYTIKKALKDPFFAKTIYGIPAIILLLLVFTKQYALQIIALLAGLYFLVKGFNLELKISDLFRSISKRFNIHRISLSFYLAFLFFLIFAIIKGVNLFVLNAEFDMVFRIVSILRAILLYIVIAFLAMVIGAIIDLFYFKKAYLLGRHIFSLFAIFIFAVLIDFALQLIISEISFVLFITTVILATILLVLLSRFTSLFNVSSKVTELLISVPVFSKYGLFLGEVIGIDDDKQIIRYKDKTTHNIKTISRKNFNLSNGRIII